ncbi:MAG: hypothetical protein ACE37K_16150 [Planctomycetota bacterium]
MRLRGLIAALLVATAPAAQQFELAGIVRAADRAPRADVAVTVRWRVHPELPGLCGYTLADGGVATEVLTTDRRGRFRGKLPVAGPFELIAATADGASMSMRRFPVMAGGFCELELIETPWVGGVVKDESGAPLAGFELALEPFEQTWARHRGCGSPITRHRLTTDGDGRWRCAFPSAYLQEPFWEPYLIPVAVDRSWLLLDGGLMMPLRRCRTLELRAKQRPLVEGIVRDPAGAPIVGARVFESFRLGGEARTDERGRFVVAARRDRLLVAASGRRLAHGDPVDGLMTFELQPAPALSVTLVHDGRPMADRRVLWRYGDRGHPPLQHWTRTDDRGVATLGGEGLGPDCIGFVEIDGRHVPFLPPKAGGRLTVAPRSLRGAIVDTNGVPLAGARITARSRQQAYVDRGDPLWVTYADHGGRFCFASLPPGQLVLVANSGAAGFAIHEVDGKATEVALQTGKHDAFEIEVVDGDDQPCPGAWITIFGMNDTDADIVAASATGNASLVAFSGEHGRVAIRGVPGGGWYGMAMRVVDGEVEATEVVRIQRGVPVRIALAPHKH